MRTIHKYRVHPQIPILANEGATVIHAALQDDLPTVWVETDTARPEERLQLVVLGTGQWVPPNGQHRGTFLTGPYVFHVYELTTMPLPTDLLDPPTQENL